MVDLRNNRVDETFKQRAVQIDTPTWERIGEAAKLARMDRSFLLSALVLEDLKVPYGLEGDEARAVLMRGRTLPEALTKGRGKVDFVHRSIYMGDVEWERLAVAGAFLGFGRSRVLTLLVWNDLHMPEDPMRHSGADD